MSNNKICPISFLKIDGNFLNACIFLLFSTALSVNAQDVVTILDLETNGSVSSKTIDTICNKICSEFAKDKRFTVIDRQFLPFTLENLDFKKPATCITNSCLTELGRHLGTKFIVGGSIRLVKKFVQINLNYVNVEKGTVKSVFSKSPMAKNEFINVKIPELVADLLKPDSTKTNIANQKESHKNAITWISGTAIAAGIAAVIIYMRASGDLMANNDLPIDDIPIHIPGQ